MPEHRIIKIDMDLSMISPFQTLERYDPLAATLHIV